MTKSKIRVILLELLIFILIPFSGYGQEKSEVDLVVRTINVHQAAAHYPLRLRGIAQAFHSDYPQQIGLIGMQELEKRKMEDCLLGESYDNGAQCLAAELAAQYGKKAEGRISEKNWLRHNTRFLGIVVDNNWEVIEQRSWDIGHNRFLLEVFLKHKKKGFRLRFYNTHLTSNSEVKWHEKIWYGYKSKKEKGQTRRNTQVEKLIEIVKTRAKPGELLPIVVGDFNAGRDYVAASAEKNVMKMEEHFLRPLDAFKTLCIDYTVVDHIYIGKKKSFPRSQGFFQTINWHRIPLRENAVFVDGHRIDELTDHHAEGFSFNILTEPDDQTHKE